MICCEIIEDLLPLYCDGTASAETKKLVLAHIAHCPSCRRKQRSIMQEIGKRYVAPQTVAGSFDGVKKRIQSRRRSSAAVFSLVALTAVYLGVRLAEATKSAERNGKEC